MARWGTAFGEKVIIGARKDGRRVYWEGKVVKESSGDQGRRGAEAKGVRGEGREARNPGVGGGSRRIGSRIADEGKAKDNVSSEDESECRKTIERMRDVVGDAGLLVFNAMYKKVQEAEGEAQAKAELAGRYYERAQAAERELEQIRKAGGASGRCGGGGTKGDGGRCGGAGSWSGNRGSRCPGKAADQQGSNAFR